MVLVAVVSVLVLANGALAQTTSKLGPGACAHAAYLAKHGQAGEAVAEFTSLLKIDPTLQCAERGIGFAAAQEVNAADPGGTQARTVAAKKAAAYAKAHPTPKSATQKLNDRGQSFKDFGQAALSVLAGVGLIAAAGLGALAAGLLLLVVAFRLPGLRQLARWLARRQWGQPKLWMRWWNRGWRRPGAWLAAFFSWLSGCTFTIKDFKAADGAKGADSAAASMRAALGIGEAASPGDAQLVSTTSASAALLSEVADALKDVPQLKVIGPLLSLGRSLLPRDDFSIDGVVMADAARGYGLAISITAEGGNVVATQTLWSNTYSPTVRDAAGDVKDADQVQRVGMAAAAWLAFRMAELRGASKPVESLGCANWNSYALFRAGVECQRSADLPRATALYAQALDADPGNHGARLNLGVIELLSGQIDIAIDRLADVQEETHRCGASPGTILKRSSLWYQAAYNLVAAEMSKKDPKGAKAYPRALELAIAIEMATKQLKRRRKPVQAARALGDFLGQIRAPAFALLADAVVVYAGPPISGPTTRPISWLDELTAARKAHLRRSNNAKGMARWLAARIVRSRFEPGRGYRAHYNLACYWTRVHHWNSALRELRLALEAGNLDDVAKTDEALAPLREKKARDWAKLVAPSDLALSGFAPMGLATATTLHKSYSIDGAHAFVKRSNTGAKREDLAEKLAVSPAAVKEWHDLLEMGTKLDLDLTTLNLLSAARITSTSELKWWGTHQPELVKVLAQANTAGSFVDTAPTADDVKAWIGALARPQQRSRSSAGSNGAASVGV